MALGCCVAVGLGSDSARVNEVAKLCRAVVHGMEGRRAPKVLLLASSESSMSGFRAIEDAEDKSCMIDWSVICEPFRFASKMSPFITVCDGLDQAFKGIWWMPWH